MTRREAIFITLGAVLTAITIFLLGSWHGKIGRYDDCVVWKTLVEPVYICPVYDGERPPVIPDGDPA